MNINGILVLYYHPLSAYAATVMENVKAFEQHSRFKVWNINTEFGFPESLKETEFQTLVLHYSLFGNWPYPLNESFLNYIERSRFSYKIALFQDEYHHCHQRFSFLNRFKVDCVYTLLEPAYFKDVYRKYTSVPKLVSYIPGYVAGELVEAAQQMSLPEERRAIDVGYRGRKLPFHMGRSAQEKARIATHFLELAKHSGLKLDIEIDEDRRIYGKKWYRFIANCRAVLGVEAGVSIFDLEDVVRTESERLLADRPTMSFEELSEKLLYQWEDNIFYRTISPRHFEASAFRVCQILFEGKYSGVMKPMVHYIPLKKDFSNFDDCVRLFQDKALRHELTENAYRDLIASGKYSYQKFIESFDRGLMEAGLKTEVTAEEATRVTKRLGREKIYLELLARKNSVLYRNFRGRRVLAGIGGPPLRMMRRLRQAISARKTPPYLKERS
jgi:hypothetical protein